MPAPHFTTETLRFLRGLRRHNDRDWFNAHRVEYDTHVKGRMAEVIERLAEDLPAFAPELIASPKVSAYRIHRDVRFSPDKSPYKTHVAAIFPHRALPKHEGAGLYFHVSPDHVFVGAGVYAPPPRHLYRLREHIAANHRRFRSLVESPRFTRSFGAHRRRAPHTSPQGVLGRGPGRRIPEAEAVSREHRAAGDVRDEARDSMARSGVCSSSWRRSSGS